MRGEHMPDNDVLISEGLARAQLDSQFSEYAGLAVRRLPVSGAVGRATRDGSRTAVEHMTGLVGESGDVETGLLSEKTTQHGRNAF
jgi:hypothetical protein